MLAIAILAYMKYTKARDTLWIQKSMSGGTNTVTLKRQATDYASLKDVRVRVRVSVQLSTYWHSKCTVHVLCLYKAQVPLPSNAVLRPKPEVNRAMGYFSKSLDIAGV